jgi:acetyl-CoA C-acetyltransferase
MQDVYIVAARRTPIGSILGSLSTVSAVELGATALRAALADTGLAPETINEVFFGNVISGNLGQAPATQVALGAGLPNTTPCTLVNKVCASGTKSVMLAAGSIALGHNHIVVAGGMENMSQVPFYAPQQRTGVKFGNAALLDGLVRDGLQDVYDGRMMGACGDQCATKYGFSREEQDAFTVRSYEMAREAQEKGYFVDEIAPVTIKGRKGDSVIDRDEEPGNFRPDKIAELKPAFTKNGTITAANASKLNDGASALILASGEAVKQHGLKPLAKILGYADAAKAPEWFTVAPADALPIALQRAGLTIDQLDKVEINEAFAVVAQANAKLLGIPTDKLNVLGGAVALGHPLGSSGARIICTLISALRHKGGKYGAVGICNGGGGASALVLEYLG